MRGDQVWVNLIKIFFTHNFRRASWHASPGLASFLEACSSVGFVAVVDLYFFWANILHLFLPISFFNATICNENVQCAMKMCNENVQCAMIRPLEVPFSGTWICQKCLFSGARKWVLECLNKKTETTFSRQHPPKWWSRCFIHLPLLDA